MEMSDFCTAYALTALFTSMDESDESGGEPMDRNYGIEDLAPETVEAFKKDCARFQKENEALLFHAYELTGNSEALAGRDFWLTRNGHGAGFWDDDWDVDGSSYNGSAIAAVAGDFGEVDLYVGDDGLIYMT